MRSIHVIMSAQSSSIRALTEPCRAGPRQGQAWYENNWVLNLIAHAYDPKSYLHCSYIKNICAGPSCLEPTRTRCHPYNRSVHATHARGVISWVLGL